MTDLIPIPLIHGEGHFRPTAVNAVLSGLALNSAAPSVLCVDGQRYNSSLSVAEVIALLTPNATSCHNVGHEVLENPTDDA